MFKFYTMGFKMTELVINIRYLKPMNKTEKAWSKKIAIEGECLLSIMPILFIMPNLPRIKLLTSQWWMWLSHNIFPIADPFVQKRNLTRTVSGNPVFEYILDRFRTSYKYFAIPQLLYGPLFLHIIFKEVSVLYVWYANVLAIMFADQFYLNTFMENH